MIRKLCWTQMRPKKHTDKTVWDTKWWEGVFYKSYKEPFAVYATVWGLHFLLLPIFSLYTYLIYVYALSHYNWRILMFMREHKRRIGIDGFLISLWLTLGKKITSPPTDLMEEYLELYERPRHRERIKAQNEWREKWRKKNIS